MKLTPTGAPERGTAGEPAHVLHWVPGYLSSDGRGTWELQDAAAYEACEPGGQDPEHDTPRDAAAGDLAAWAAGQLGYPVELEAFSARIRAITIRPPSIHVGAEPAYYVRPAGGR